MTKRSAHQHRMLELKERLMSKVANRLFTFKTTGFDGFVKRKLLADAKSSSLNEKANKGTNKQAMATEDS